MAGIASGNDPRAWRLALPTPDDFAAIAPMTAALRHPERGDGTDDAHVSSADKVRGVALGGFGLSSHTRFER